MTTERIADHIKFAYWVPNVSGGLVTSDIVQRTDWNYDYNAKLAQTAENSGFEYALSQVRYEASYGAEYQHESTSLSLALLLATQKLKVIAAVHPGLWQPAVLAKLGATADHLSNGRFAVNVVSGWFKDEFTHLGEPWLEHDERYRRSAEFLQVLRKIWTEDDVDFRGDFTLKPKPLNTAERPNPEIFQGGNSTAARRNGCRYADWYFSNGKDFDGVTEQIIEVRDHAREAGREVRFGLNGFIIARDSEKEAKEVFREIIEKANRPAVEGFRAAVQQAGNASPDKKGMWADSTFEDLVQYNDGFRTQLIGTRADRGTRCGVPQTRCRPHPWRLPPLPGGDRIFRLTGTTVGAGNRRFRRGFGRRARTSVGLRASEMQMPAALTAGCASVGNRIAQASSTGEVMTYPPGSPGYPPAQQPTTQFAAPTQQFGKVPESAPAAPAAEGPSKLPLYLTAAVAALGLAVYLSSFGPLFTASAEFYTPMLVDLGVVASILAALIAGVALLPKQTPSPALVAVLSVLGFLLVVAIVLTVPEGVTIDWGLYLIIAFSVVQAILAVAVLLFDAGIITPPVPKPRYDQQQQYGQYGGPGQYYGQPQGQPQQHGGAHQLGPHQQPQQQRPGYPSQYGSYPGGGPSTGGFSGGQAGPQGGQSGPPTPPTGFPTYGQPSSSTSAPTTQVPAQPQSSSSSQSGQSPS